MNIPSAVVIEYFKFCLHKIYFYLKYNSSKDSDNSAYKVK